MFSKTSCLHTMSHSLIIIFSYITYVQCQLIHIQILEFSYAHCHILVLLIKCLKNVIILALARLQSIFSWHLLTLCSTEQEAVTLRRRLFKHTNFLSFMILPFSFCYYCRSLKKTLSIHVHNVVLWCLMLQNDYTAAPYWPGMLTWVFSTVSALLWGKRNTYKDLRCGQDFIANGEKKNQFLKISVYMWM